jgi:hypothetical protein
MGNCQLTSVRVSKNIHITPLPHETALTPIADLKMFSNATREERENDPINHLSACSLRAVDETELIIGFLQ